MRKHTIAVGVCVAATLGSLSVMVADAKARTLEDGFIAICVNVSGHKYRDGSWNKDKYSGSFKIVYDGGNTFRIAGDLFEYKVVYKTNLEIAGIGIYRKSIYTMGISAKTNKLTYTYQDKTLSDTTRAAAFVGNCEIGY